MRTTRRAPSHRDSRCGRGALMRRETSRTPPGPPSSEFWLSGGLELALHGKDHLFLAPLHDALGGHALDDLGHHVRQDVVVLDPADGVVRFRGPAARMRVL